MIYSKSLINFINRFAALFLVLANCCFCLALEIRFFNCGQANTIFIAYKEKSIIVDCGGIYSTDINNYIKKEYKNISAAIITHQHTDHYNGLKDFYDGENIIIGGIYDTVDAQSKSDVLQNIDKFYKADSSSNEELNKILKNVLGTDVNVEILLPKESVGNTAHDQNLVVKITYAGRSILLPGDANGKLIKQIIKDNPCALNNIDIWVMPHHGSLYNGEDLLYQYLFQPDLIQPCLTLVSSNPSGKDKLPSYLLPSLSFSNADNCYCAQHCFTSYNQATSNVTKQLIKKPLFITSESDTYYKVTITTQGTIILQNGEEEPLFCYTKYINKSFKNYEDIVKYSLKKLHDMLFVNGANSLNSNVLKTDKAKALFELLQKSKNLDEILETKQSESLLFLFCCLEANHNEKSHLQTTLKKILQKAKQEQRLKYDNEKCILYIDNLKVSLREIDQSFKDILISL